MPRIAPQLVCFSYHKSGTSLFFHVMTKVSERLGLTLANHYGLVERLDPAPDVVLLPHSVLRARLDWPYRAIRLIRDPRDIWLSGYLYHLRCDEAWCRNADFDPTPPIGWPQVDYSMAYWPEDWKRHYLERLNGRSYQQNLRDRSLADGLDFELAGYTGCTMAAMSDWKLNRADALDVRLEDVMADFDAAMLLVFRHFGFTEDACEAALEVARSEDVRRMDDAAIAERPQVYSRTISKWRAFLPAAQIARFEAAHGDLIRALGYDAAGPHGLGEPDADAPSPNLPPPLAGTLRDAGICLSVDGATIRPAVIGPGSCSFVVPPGSGRVWLESRSATDPGMRDLGNTRLLGVRVREIAIRSDAGEVVIAGDDPRLTTGWHDAERVEATPWRWTDGSAELPWSGVAGPAVVTVRCTALVKYASHGETNRH